MSTPVCPDPDTTGGFPVFFPHDSDRSKYYECQGDWLVEMDCPPGLEFDPELNVCNWPFLINRESESAE